MSIESMPAGSNHALVVLLGHLIKLQNCDTQSRDEHSYDSVL